MKIIDAHNHIDCFSDKEIADIMTNKDVIIVSAAMNFKSGERLLNLYNQFKDTNRFYICLGIHPEYEEYFDQFQVVKNQIINNRDKIVAIGEIGLPYYSLENKTENEVKIIREFDS